MTVGLSGARVTVLPVVLPKTSVGDLEMAGKRPLTWGGRYWVRTSDLFGVKNVRPIFLAGQTLKRLMGSGLTRPITAVRDASRRVHAPGCSHREQPETPDGWPFIPPYDPTTDELPSPVTDPPGRDASEDHRPDGRRADARSRCGAGDRPARPARVRGPVMGELALRVIDPAGLNAAQRSGAECALCCKRWPRPTAFFGCLPDGTAIRVCVDCDLPVVAS